MFGKVNLKDEKIIDRWSMIVEDDQGFAKQIYANTDYMVAGSRYRFRASPSQAESIERHLGERAEVVDGLL